MQSAEQWFIHSNQGAMIYWWDSHLVHCNNKHPADDLLANLTMWNQKYHWNVLKKKHNDDLLTASNLGHADLAAGVCWS